MSKRSRSYAKPKRAKKRARVSSKSEAAAAFYAGSGERKYFDVAINEDISTTALFYGMCTLGQGATQLTRIGDKIHTRYVNLRLSYSLESQAANQKFRIIIYIDKTPQANDPVVGYLLEAATIESQRAKAKIGRFHILSDEVVVVNQTNAVANNLQKGFYSKFVRIPTKYSIASYDVPTAAIPITNAIGIMTLGDTATGATDLDVAGTARLCFTG